MARVGRTLALVFVGTMLLLSLVSANVVVGADRTVLDREFVKESFEEENAYGVLHDEVTQQLASEENVDTGETDLSVDEVLSDVVTERYVQDQVESNVDNTYDYLHGETDRFRVALDTRPVKDRLVREVEETVIEENVSQYDEQLAEMAESEQQYQQERTEFEEERKERIQEETDRQLSEAELDARYDERREDIRSELRDELEDEVAAEDRSQEVEDALVELGMVRVNGLVEEDLTYGEFTSDLTDAKESLAGAIANSVEEQLDEEMPDTMVLSEDMDEGTQQSLETLRSGASLVGILVFLLPLVSLLLGGLLVWLAPARSTGLLAAGSVTVLAGLGSVVAISVIEGTVTSEVNSMVATDGTPRAFADLLLGLVDQFLGAFGWQSWLLVAIGVLLVAVGVVLRFDLLPVDELLGDDAGEDAGRAGAENEGSDGAGGGTDDREN